MNFKKETKGLREIASLGLAGGRLIPVFLGKLAVGGLGLVIRGEARDGGAGRGQHATLDGSFVLGHALQHCSGTIHCRLDEFLIDGIHSLLPDPDN